MIKIIKLNSIGQYIDNVFNLKNGEFDNTGYIFRGVNNKKHELCSSLYRNCNDCSNRNYIETRLLQNFKKYALLLEPHVCDSIWSTMIIAQHHGLPTRLLDFSSSPLMALHFALTDNKNTDAAVWAINLSKIHSNLLPEKYKLILKENNAFAFTIEMLKNIAVEDYNNDMGGEHFFVIEPPSIDIRIINQGSLFAVLPDELDPLDAFFKNSLEKNIAIKYIIPKENIHQFRAQLDEMNITERTLFNDLDGVAQYLKRRYQ